MSDRPERLPNWTWDETVLAWDLYLREYVQPMRYADANHAGVRALSEELRALPVHPEHVRRGPEFRNPNGVARKVQNLMWCATGQYGSPNASQVDRLVVARLAEPDAVRRVVVALRDVAPSLHSDDAHEDDDEFSREEGDLLPRFHRVRERNSAVVRRKKERAINSGKPILCEGCGVHVAAAYGVEEGALIECHHRSALAEGVRKTKLSDLAFVCPTCHRALHRTSPMITVEELAARLGDARPDSGTGARR